MSRSRLWPRGLVKAAVFGACSMVCCDVCVWIELRMEVYQNANGSSAMCDLHVKSYAGTRVYLTRRILFGYGVKRGGFDYQLKSAQWSWYLVLSLWIDKELTGWLVRTRQQQAATLAVWHRQVTSDPTFSLSGQTDFSYPPSHI